MLQAMIMEIEKRSHYLEDKNIHSIYFGGGTPSILDAEDIMRLISTVEKHFEIDNNAEITLEANPDDLTASKVKSLRDTPINRFSIGIQSFYEEDLLWMNRAHNATEADSSIKRVQDAGFENITCDLIYGYPLLTDQKWKSNMQRLIDLDIPHISSYSMTVEKKTALAHFVREGKTPAMSDNQSAQQMLMLIETLTTNGFEHYEISNFAKNQQYARHNTNYWRGQHYLGIGPSAHSFNGDSRSWNVSNNAKYIAALRDSTSYTEVEKLSKDDQFNEYIMTSARTMWGIDLQKVEQVFGYDYKQHLIRESKSFVEAEELESINNNILRTTTKGKLLADHIASELFVISE